MNHEEALKIAERIASGHAMTKHVSRRREFTELIDREQFRRLIFEILFTPDAERDLARNRRAYWSDKHLTIVITDPKSDCGGTAFRPINGKGIFPAWPTIKKWKQCSSLAASRSNSAERISATLTTP